METQPQIPEQPTPNVDALRENTDITTARFNLSMPNRGKGLLEDVIVREKEMEMGNFRRFLVVDAQLVDENIWNGLKEANVPQIPLISRGSGVWLFGVKNGLKPLANEALYGQQSSDTYIGDQEIFYEAGRLYRAAYEATGYLMLDANKPEDCPLDHLAISNFKDEQGNLFFYPPYTASPQYANLTLEEASTLVSQTTENRLTGQLIYNESVRQTSDELVHKMREGFEAA